MRPFLHCLSYPVPSDFHFSCFTEILLPKAIHKLIIVKSVTSSWSFTYWTLGHICLHWKLPPSSRAPFPRFGHISLGKLFFCRFVSLWALPRCCFPESSILDLLLLPLYSPWVASLTHRVSVLLYSWCPCVCLSPAQSPPPSFSLLCPACLASSRGCHPGPSCWPHPHRTNHQPLLTCSASCSLYFSPWHHHLALCQAGKVRIVLKYSFPLTSHV